MWPGPVGARLNFVAAWLPVVMVWCWCWWRAETELG